MNKKNLTEKELNKKLDRQHKLFVARMKKLRARGADRAARQAEVTVTGGHNVFTGRVDDWDHTGFCDMGCGMW